MESRDDENSDTGEVGSWSIKKARIRTNDKELDVEMTPTSTATRPNLGKNVCWVRALGLKV